MPAPKLHEADLKNFFHDVTELGAATTRVSTLMRWMEWEKQTSGFWAEVQERFQNALEEEERLEGWQLLSVQNDGHITLICSDPEGTDVKDRWWQRVRVLAERPSPGRRKQIIVAQSDREE